MMASLEKFCKDQFLGRRQADNCQLAVEELASSVLLPAINRTRQGSFSLTLQAGEEGTNRQLTIDGSDFPEWKTIADKLTEIIPADKPMKTGPANEGVEKTERTSAGKAEIEKMAKKGAGTAGKEIEEASAAILAKLLRRLSEKEKTGEEAEGNAVENALENSNTMVFRIL